MVKVSVRHFQEYTRAGRPVILCVFHTPSTGHDRGATGLSLPSSHAVIGRLSQPLTRALTLSPICTISRLLWLSTLLKSRALSRALTKYPVETLSYLHTISLALTIQSKGIMERKRERSEVIPTLFLGCVCRYQNRRRCEQRSPVSDIFTLCHGQKRRGRREEWRELSNANAMAKYDLPLACFWAEADNGKRGVWGGHYSCDAKNIGDFGIW